MRTSGPYEVAAAALLLKAVILNLRSLAGEHAPQQGIADPHYQVGKSPDVLQ